MKDIPTLIRNKRIEKGISQAKLAEMVGMQQPSIARLESGKIVPSLETVERIANALDLQVKISFKNKKGVENGKS